MNSYTLFVYQIGHHSGIARASTSLDYLEAATDWIKKEAIKVLPQYVLGKKLPSEAFMESPICMWWNLEQIGLVPGDGAPDLHHLPHEHCQD